MSESEFGLTASAYLSGAVAGALGFSWLMDRVGRKKLLTTVLIYLLATIASGLSWSFASLALFRFITGLGIGGKYAAVNATIQELIPARERGFTDLLHRRQLLDRRHIWCDWRRCGIGSSGDRWLSTRR